MTLRGGPIYIDPADDDDDDDDAGDPRERMRANRAGRRRRAQTTRLAPYCYCTDNTRDADTVNLALSESLRALGCSETAARLPISRARQAPRSRTTRPGCTHIANVSHPRFRRPPHAPRAAARPHNARGAAQALWELGTANAIVIMALARHSDRRASRSLLKRCIPMPIMCGWGQRDGSPQRRRGMEHLQAAGPGGVASTREDESRGATTVMSDVALALPAGGPGEWVST